MPVAKLKKWTAPIVLAEYAANAVVPIMRIAPIADKFLIGIP